MTRINRKDIVWISAAFVLLCAVSAYRQVSLRFFPADPFRAAVAYFVYLVMLAGWWVSIRVRITQRSMYLFLLAENMLILIGITIRFIQDSILYLNTWLMRVSGYWIVIPIVLLPLFGYYVSLGLGKAEEYQVNRNWFYLMIPAGLLILLTLTNESHHIIFRLMADETQANLYFHPNAGVYVVIAWAFLLELARIILVYHRSRELEDYPYLKFMPLIVIALMLVLCVYYLSRSFYVQNEFFEYYVMLFFLEIVVWESCVMVGMIPVNTYYEEVFDRSTVAMQILDEAGRPYLKSSSAPEISPETLSLLKRQAFVRKPEGLEVHLQEIQGGYSIWQNDVSQTIAVIEELQESARKLENESVTISQELSVRSDEAAVKEQNDIYNRLTNEVGGQLLLIRRLLEKLERDTNIPEQFKKICLIGTYIKRRCNLRLIEQSDGMISNQEMELCFNEMASCLKQLGVEAEVILETSNTPSPEFAIFALDTIEYILENENFEIQAIKVAFETNTLFSVSVLADSEPPAWISAGMIQGLAREPYDIQTQTFDAGYRVLVDGGRQTNANLH